MGQSIEAQRAIIEGYDFMMPYKIFEARAILVVPDVTLLNTYDSLTFLSLQGRWHPKKGYIANSIVINETVPFHLEIAGNIRPRTIILEDGRIYRKNLIPHDPDRLPEEEYEKRVLVPSIPFDFEAIWERVG